jgi:hypothetical protein
VCVAAQSGCPRGGPGTPGVLGDQGGGVGQSDYGSRGAIYTASIAIGGPDCPRARHDPSWIYGDKTAKVEHPIGTLTPTPSLPWRSVAEPIEGRGACVLGDEVVAEDHAGSS